MASGAADDISADDVWNNRQILYKNHYPSRGDTMTNVGGLCRLDGSVCRVGESSSEYIFDLNSKLTWSEHVPISLLVSRTLKIGLASLFREGHTIFATVHITNADFAHRIRERQLKLFCFPLINLFDYEDYKLGRVVSNARIDGVLLSTKNVDAWREPIQQIIEPMDTSPPNNEENPDDDDWD